MRQNLAGCGPWSVVGGRGKAAAVREFILILLKCIAPLQLQAKRRAPSARPSVTAGRARNQPSREDGGVGGVRRAYLASSGARWRGAIPHHRFPDAGADGAAPGASPGELEPRVAARLGGCVILTEATAGHAQRRS
ncbi:hypothetical protein SEVIR_1G052766v4 [Setaria viridis]